MLSLSHFDEKLRATRAGSHETFDQRVEMFTQSGIVYLRVGSPPDDTEGEAPVTIELPKDAFIKFHNGVRVAGRFSGHLP